MPRWGPRAVSSILWALTRMGAKPNEAWMDQLFQATRLMLRQMSGRDASNLMWALHRRVPLAPRIMPAAHP